MKQSGWKFIVEHTLGKSAFRADWLNVGGSGTVSVFRRDKMVGVFRDGQWNRVFIDANQQDEKP